MVPPVKSEIRQKNPLAGQALQGESRLVASVDAPEPGWNCRRRLHDPLPYSVGFSGRHSRRKARDRIPLARKLKRRVQKFRGSGAQRLQNRAESLCICSPTTCIGGVIAAMKRMSSVAEVRSSPDPATTPA